MTREPLSGFFLLSVMAGVYVGFGIMLIFSVGANMTLRGVGLFIPRGFPGVSWTGYVYNLFWVTFGNMIGGAVCVGWAYWFIAREQIKAAAVGDDRKTISQ